MELELKLLVGLVLGHGLLERAVRRALPGMYKGRRGEDPSQWLAFTALSTACICYLAARGTAAWLAAPAAEADAAMASRRLLAFIPAGARLASARVTRGSRGLAAAGPRLSARALARALPPWPRNRSCSRTRCTRSSPRCTSAAGSARR